jgi:hypothetical protein
MAGVARAQSVLILLAGVLLALLPGQAWAREPLPPPSMPITVTEDIPDFFQDDFVSWDVPECGGCDPIPAVIEPAPIAPFPEASWDVVDTVQGLAAWEMGHMRQLMRGLACWMLNAQQHASNAAGEMQNSVIVLLNEVVRWMVYLAMVGRVLIETLFYVLEHVRYLGGWIITLLIEIRVMLADVVMLLVMLVESAAVMPYLWFVLAQRVAALMTFVGTIMNEAILSVLDALMGTEAIPGIIESNHMLYSFFRGMQDALQAHPMTSWVYILWFGMVTLMWVIWASRTLSQSD